MESQPQTAAGAEDSPDQELTAGVKLLVMHLPEDEGEGLGLRLTRTLWDPYPWVREVSPGGVAAAAGLRPGACLLQVDGTDLLGLPVGSVASLIRGDGGARDVMLVTWHCGTDPSADPELLWSCGGGRAGEVSRRALGGVLRALACAVCRATATPPRRCHRDHLYCQACWSRLQRCALCREPLPDARTPQARSLVAEQVFEAIATEYELKNIPKRLSASAHTSPNRSPQRSPNLSPNMSPSTPRRGQYQLSLMGKKQVQFNERNRNYLSDPNLHRSVEKGPTYTFLAEKVPASSNISSSAEKNNNPTEILSNPTEKVSNPGETNEDSTNQAGNSKCSCQAKKKCSCGSDASSGNTVSCHCQSLTNIQARVVPVISVEDSETGATIPHRLVSRLRGACSLLELGPAHAVDAPSISAHCKAHGSSDDITNKEVKERPILLVSGPPIYFVSCAHAEQ